MSFVVLDHHKCAKQVTIQQQQKTTTTTKTTTKATTNYNNSKHSTNVMDKGCISFVPCTRAWAKFGKGVISTSFFWGIGPVLAHVLHTQMQSNSNHRKQQSAGSIIKTCNVGFYTRWICNGGMTTL